MGFLFRRISGVLPMVDSTLSCWRAGCGFIVPALVIQSPDKVLLMPKAVLATTAPPNTGNELPSRRPETRALRELPAPKERTNTIFLRSSLRSSDLLIPKEKLREEKLRGKALFGNKNTLRLFVLAIVAAP